MIVSKLAVALIALSGMSGAMAADTYFDYSFAGGAGYSGNLVLGGTSLGSGDYFINSVTGTVDGGQSVSLLPTSSPAGIANGQPYFVAPATPGIQYEYNDVLYTGTTLPFDFYGLGLQTTSGNAINLYALGTGLVYVDNGRLTTFGNTAIANVPITSNISSAVPEPGTYAMMLVGLAAVGFIAWRRQPRTPSSGMAFAA